MFPLFLNLVRYSRVVNAFLQMNRNYQNIFKYLPHQMMIYVLHDMQRIIWVVSWKQIVNFVLICEQATLAIANDADDANAKKCML